ncbi:MAG TPA: TolC family protein [Bacteroidia bacterium]|jgi:outer membrane protein|nr:TolC family protein [Bacteroidia bacterium]
MKLPQTFRFVLLLLAPLFTQAQTKTNPWSLQQCIEYALKNNIQVRQTALSRQINEVTLSQYKANLLPTLNANASHSYNFGRTIDQYTNTFADKLVLSENFSLNTSIVLFNGLQKVNTVHQGEYDLLSSREDLEKTKNDISLNIAGAYLQILFNDELLTVARNQVGISQTQVERTKKLVDAGALAKGNLLQLQAQLATDELTATTAQNQLDISYLSLAQLLDLDSVGSFTIVRPELSMPSEALLTQSSNEIFNQALAIQPAVKSAQFKLKSYDMQLRVAKGGIYPRLLLNAGIGSGYSGASLESVGTPTGFTTAQTGLYTATGVPVVQVIPTGTSTEVIPFRNQVNDNFNRSIGLYLSVPIFNGWQVHGNIERAKLSLQNADLNVQAQELQLRKTIQQQYADANAALIKYNATKRTVEATQESFKYTDQKFSVGLLNSLDFNDAKNKLIKAQSDLLQAKYDYIFKIKVLDFYQGKPLTL